jgi:hypothetical protein
MGERKPFRTHGALHGDGTHVYSYAATIAEFNPDAGRWQLVMPWRMSVTTTRHVNKISGAITALETGRF